MTSVSILMGMRLGNAIRSRDVSVSTVVFLLVLLRTNWIAEGYYEWWPGLQVLVDEIWIFNLSFLSCERGIMDSLEFRGLRHELGRKQSTRHTSRPKRIRANKSIVHMISRSEFEITNLLHCLISISQPVNSILCFCDYKDRYACSRKHGID